ncbi:uncharacterized protein TNIN_296091 [Trichonephila inaurata madagascariensis]|uniref:Transposase n=1 Tax=Trichonephila inaurata madagascariensis TaxID=2747483 RepID=A0A8X7BTN4_9ARAC|nr:uncharacterized protein TNIN_296091 [Trichonephila inaurata madagascariensis]
METPNPSPAACEVRSVIKFLNAQCIAPIEIHRQIYGPNTMRKEMVRRWCRQFPEGRQSVHDKERSGRPYIVHEGCPHMLIIDNATYFRSSEFSDFCKELWISKKEVSQHILLTLTEELKGRTSLLLTSCNTHETNDWDDQLTYTMSALKAIHEATHT